MPPTSFAWCTILPLSQSYLDLVHTGPPTSHTMRTAHNPRNLPLLTAKRQSNKSSSGIAPFLGALAAIVILLLVGYQTFPLHIHASLAEHDFPNGGRHMTTNISIPGGTMQGVVSQGTDSALANGAVQTRATLVTYLTSVALGPNGPMASELSNFQFFLAQGLQPFPSVSYLLFLHKVPVFVLFMSQFFTSDA